MADIGTRAKPPEPFVHWDPEHGDIWLEPHKGGTGLGLCIGDGLFGHEGDDPQAIRRRAVKEARQALTTALFQLDEIERGEPIVHGVTCEKRPHTAEGYGHAADHDGV